jgi:D-serine deaminase-like pyridoxal phosphate-dependent protein
MDTWSGLTARTEFLSPSLVIDRALVRRNLETMIAVARGADRLRPHVKTHKMWAVVRLAESLGIHKHKCATIAEAEMVAWAGGRDALLAYPLVGPNVDRFAALVRRYPGTTFRAVVDDEDWARVLSDAIRGADSPVPVLLDLDVGMGRTGIDPAGGAAALYELISGLPNLTPDGLHAYDGHVNDPDPAARADRARVGVEQTLALRDRLLAKGLPVPRLVLGGTPTFTIHAANETPGVELSPGTCTLHDNGYASKFPDLPFTRAAVLFSRVISRPKPGRLTLDLGYKAVAADPVGARVHLIEVPGASLAFQSEEHLVVDTPAADRYPPGTPVLAYPTHICPTCALHRRAYVIEDGCPVDEWEVAARDRVLSC